MIIGAVTRTLVHLLLAALVTLPLAILLLQAYRKAIGRWMRVPADGHGPLSPAPSALPRSGASLEVKWAAATPPETGTAASEALARSARRGRNQAAFVYGVAGLLHAATTTAIVVVIGHYSLNLATTIAFFLVLSWPTVLLVSKLAIARRALRWLVPLTIAAATALLAGPYLGLMFDVWRLYVLPPLLLILCVSARRFRTAGLLLFPSLFVVLTCTRHVWMAGAGWLLTLAALILSVVLVLLLLFALSRLHERKIVSETDLMLDTEWFFLTVWQAFCLVVHVGYLTVLGLIPFVVYKAAVLAGRKFTARDPAENCPLLLLRTFGARTRSEGLLEQLGMTWRHIGSIQLIGAPDVAGAYLEPGQFLGFITGRLRGLFVQDQASLDRRLAALDWQRDADGRFRVNECFCFDRIWREAVRRLLGQSRAVLMDLRAFNAKRAGCIEELALLMNSYPLKKVVFLVDDTTDRPGLTSALQNAWQTRDAASPNQDGDRVLKLFVATSNNDTAGRNLLVALCAAAV